MKIIRNGLRAVLFGAGAGYKVDSGLFSFSGTVSLSNIDLAIQNVSTARSTFGAVQNRLLSTISNLQNVTENVTAARSRIQDADFAAETANLTRASILQQAGISVLAQANALPQQTLALLQ